MTESDAEKALWMDKTLDDLKKRYEKATTKDAAAHILIRAVHATRRWPFLYDSSYMGVLKSKYAIEYVSGVKLGDYPEIGRRKKVHKTHDEIKNQSLEFVKSRVAVKGGTLTDEQLLLIGMGVDAAIYVLHSEEYNPKERMK